MRRLRYRPMKASPNAPIQMVIRAMTNGGKDMAIGPKMCWRKNNHGFRPFKPILTIVCFFAPLGSATASISTSPARSKQRRR